MTNQNIPAPANQLSDEYVNSVIQRHGYDSPESVIAQLWQWIGLCGGENSVTLLMYEAHKALSKLRAPVADERAAFEAEYVDHCGMRLEDYDFDYDPATNRYRDDCEQSAWWGWHTGRADQASAPVAQDAAEVHSLTAETGYTGVAPAAPVTRQARPTDWQNALRIAELPEVDEALANFCDDSTLDNAVGLVLTVLGAAPPASAPVAGEALGWRVRERRSNDGKLLDCFVEAPAAPGMAYAQEVLGDDYAEAQGGIEGKLKHCRMIVAWASAAPQASEAVRNEGLERARRLPEVKCSHCELKVVSSCGSAGCPVKDRYADLRALSAQPGAQKKEQSND